MCLWWYACIHVYVYLVFRKNRLLYLKRNDPILPTGRGEISVALSRRKKKVIASPDPFLLPYVFQLPQCLLPQRLLLQTIMDTSQWSSRSHHRAPERCRDYRNGFEVAWSCSDRAPASWTHCLRAWVREGRCLHCWRWEVSEIKNFLSCVGCFDMLQARVFFPTYTHAACSNDSGYLS